MEVTRKFTGDLDKTLFSSSVDRSPTRGMRKRTGLWKLDRHYNNTKMFFMQQNKTSGKSQKPMWAPREDVCFDFGF